GQAGNIRPGQHTQHRFPVIYNGVTMPLTAIADFAEKGKTDPLFKELARLVEETHGIWNEQAEKYLLAQFGVDIGEAAQ
ncbi:hypothetical protein FSH48_005525, partial [Escherichia coli]|nr:hypothetical protein [Escherichia coli]